MANIILDTVDIKKLKPVLKARGIKYKIINLFGPAGGFPEIKYYANPGVLMELIKDYWQDEDLFLEIKKVK